MTAVATHPGGPFYVWYHDTYGYNPPATVDSDAARYLAWQRGVPHVLAALIPYGAMGDPGQWIAGGAILQAPVIAAPAPPAPPPPPPAPKPVILLPGVGAAGSAPLAPVLATLPTGEQMPTTAGGLLTEPTGTTAIPLPADATPILAARELPTQYGQTYTQEQIQVVGACLNEGLSRHAPRLALEAMVYAIMGESDITDAPGGGWFQTSCDLSLYSNGSDYRAQAAAFFTGGTCFHNAGAIGNSGGYGTAWQIANAVEDNAVWSQRQGDSYARGGFTTAQLTQEAEYAVSYFLPGLGTTVSSPGATPQPTTPTTGGIFDLMDSLSWAGDFINLWKYLQGGANEAANMAGTFETSRINQITTIGWS